MRTRRSSRLNRKTDILKHSYSGNIDKDITHPYVKFNAPRVQVERGNGKLEYWDTTEICHFNVNTAFMPIEAFQFQMQQLLEKGWRPIDFGLPDDESYEHIAKYVGNHIRRDDQLRQQVLSEVASTSDKSKGDTMSEKRSQKRVN